MALDLRGGATEVEYGGARPSFQGLSRDSISNAMRVGSQCSTSRMYLVT